MNGALARRRLGEARLMLLFTPELRPADAGAPLDALEAALPHVDVVQVRVKDGERSPARELHDWTVRVVERVAERALVLVNDRVDVCAALLAHGVDGVHLGDRDMPVDDARRLLGDAPLIGLSTHSAHEIAATHAMAVDYLGFGPVFPTETKGYSRGFGPEAAWVAAEAASVPVFPIGGIAADNAAELDQVGRACVGSAILASPDPARAAEAIREALLR